MNLLVYPGYFEALVQLLARLLYCSLVCVLVVCHCLNLLTVEGHGPVVQNALVLLHPLKREEAVVLVVIFFLLLALLFLFLADHPVSLVPLGLHPLVLVISLDGHATWKGCATDEANGGILHNACLTDASFAEAYRLALHEEGN